MIRQRIDARRTDVSRAFVDVIDHLRSDSVFLELRALRDSHSHFHFFNSMENSSSKECRYCDHFPFKSPFQTPPPSLSPAFELTPTSTSYYTRRYSPPNCFALAISHGLRGAAIGSVFGGAFALSTAVSSGYRGSSLVSYTGAAALRNAAGFASWTSLYAFSRCGLVRLRGRHDLLNSAAAGAFTGGVLTVLTSPQVMRYQRSALMTNMAASAMVAVVFDAVNRF